MQRPLPPRIAEGALNFGTMQGACKLIDCDACKGSGERDPREPGRVWCSHCGGYPSMRDASFRSPAVCARPTGPVAAHSSREPESGPSPHWTNN